MVSLNLAPLSEVTIQSIFPLGIRTNLEEFKQNSEQQCLLLSGREDVALDSGQLDSEGTDIL